MVLISSGIDFSQIEGGDLFQNLSFTIKNYNKNMRLEEVNLDKAYLAMINSVGKQWQKSLYRFFTYDNNTKKNNEIYKHLEHFRNIFALIGLGSE